MHGKLFLCGVFSVAPFLHGGAVAASEIQPDSTRLLGVEESRSHAYRFDAGVTYTRTGQTFHSRVRGKVEEAVDADDAKSQAREMIVARFADNGVAASVGPVKVRMIHRTIDDVEKWAEIVEGVIGAINGK